MSKNLTIICFALLGLGADVLCLRQTLITQSALDLSSLPLLISYSLIALALIACALLFAKRDLFKKL